MSYTQLTQEQRYQIHALLKMVQTNLLTEIAVGYRTVSLQMIKSFSLVQFQSLANMLILL
jgi:hypothetical protein